jgi:hypothetical protein
MKTRTKDPRLAEIKKKVAAKGYIVDPGLVAEAMLEKMRLVSRVRRQLIDDPEADLSLLARHRSHRRAEHSQAVRYAA